MTHSHTSLDNSVDSSYVAQLFSYLANTISENLEGYTPAQIVVFTLAAVGLAEMATKLPELARAYQHVSKAGVRQSAIDIAYKVALHAPILGRLVDAYADEQIEKNLMSVTKETFERRIKHGFTQTSLPDQGKSVDEILAQIDAFRSKPVVGKQSGALYVNPNPDMLKLVGGLAQRYSYVNATQTSVWSDPSDMEAQVVAWMTTYFQGRYPVTKINLEKKAEAVTEQPKKPGFFAKAQSVCASTLSLYKRLNERANQKEKNTIPRKLPGMITTGGTQSIGVAIWIAINTAKKRGIAVPEVVVPDSAHTAFKNMTQRFGGKLIRVPVNSATGAADVNAMSRHINKNTCMLAGSAPSFPWGVFDPIDELAKLAKTHRLPFHMDACIGFPQVFAERAEIDMPCYGFQNEGVTSISCDTHKYGFAPKGESVVLLHEDLSNGVYGDFDWPGGLYVALFMEGSRAGLPIASAYAFMTYFGDRGYLEELKNTLLLTREIADELRKIDGIRIPYETKATIIGITTAQGINSHLVASKLKEAGWEVNILIPTGFHMCITAAHTHDPSAKEKFISAVSDAVSYAKAHPKEQPTGLAKSYGKLSSEILPTPIAAEIARSFAAINNTLPIVSDAHPSVVEDRIRQFSPLRQRSFQSSNDTEAASRKSLKK